MKKVFLLFVMLSIASCMVFSQTEKIAEFIYSEESFDFYKYTNGTIGIIPLGANDFGWHEDLTEPALPYEMRSVPIEEKEELVDFKCSFTEKLVCEDVVIMQTPMAVPTGGGGGYSGTIPVYEDKVYPDENITYVNKMLIDGQYCLRFEVCPFRYDAAEKKLYLLTDIKLNITLKSEQSANSSFVENGKEWQARLYVPYYNDNLGISYKFPYNFVMEGDTLIGAKACKKLYVYERGDRRTTEYLEAVYEEGQKVYFVPKGSEEGLLMYDFGAKDGEIVTVYSSPVLTPFDKSYKAVPIPMRVLREEERMVNSIRRHCLLVVGEDNYQSMVDDAIAEDVEQALAPYTGWWIEGIGTERGPLENWAVGMMGSSLTLCVCTVGTDTLYYDGTYDEQTKRMLVDDGKRWNCLCDRASAGAPEEYNEEYSYFVDGDTLINGMPCKKIYYESKDGGSCYYYGAVYEAKSKVYYFPKGEEREVLLYDFTCQPGDRLVANGQEIYIKDVTEEIYHGVSRKCVVWRPVWDWVTDEMLEWGPFATWIEGIGSTKDLFFYQPLDGNYNRLISCEQNGKILYGEEPAKPSLYDLDGDGVLTLNDITTLINVYLEMSR